MSNTVQRFLFDDLDIRGAIVRLDLVWEKMMGARGYPSLVACLLGQMSAVTLLLADNLKQPGRLTVQMRGDGPVSMMVIDCNEQLNLRCMAHYAEKIASLPLIELLGKGQLQLSLDAALMREPYQSIVPLDGQSIAEVFEHYLGQSEQLSSRFFLAATPSRVAGLFLQKMPSADERDSDGWTRLEALAATVREEELTDLANEDLLNRLFQEETIRVFKPQPITNDCPKDWEKVGNILLTLGREEIYANLEEHGIIVINDELSNLEYRFTPSDIDELFSRVPQTPKTVH